MTSSLRARTAIVGIGTAGLGEAPGLTHLDLTAQAAAAAVEDAGLRMDQVDGLFTANMVNFMPTLAVSEYLGIRPLVSNGTNTGGNSFIDHVQWAAMALDAGLCSVALICYGSNQRTARAPVMPPDSPPFDHLYGPREPITSYALAAARYLDRYGATREDLAHVVVSSRRWAALNPEAFARDPLEVGDVLGARMISDPLSVLDCCLVTDGAGAVVMTRSEAADDGPNDPAYVLGVASAVSHRQISAMPDLTVTAAVDSGRRALAMAGAAPSDVDVAQLYDAFSINVLLFLEDLGLCGRGEAGAFVADGNIAPGGSLPVNTNGGGLSFTHPGMYGIFTLIEATHQLRGTAGARQQPSVDVALCHGNGGLLSAQSTAVLGSRATLT